MASRDRPVLRYQHAVPLDLGLHLSLALDDHAMAALEPLAAAVQGLAIQAGRAAARRAPARG
ncbi:hypothetical protein GCM10017653_26710 [Ancylobacter defluvii]|uniref:Uncharacterized protein n=1 Tax=Ancylobacter defluvii TaxID=1282440 RepID=A0A9W6JVM2_9HYPH|nr:hypothetical protein GCM10017653_26710 [Ancylobacter defluvii]